MGLGIAIAVGGSPDEELAAAVLVEVHERIGEMTTYRLRYDIDVVEGDFPMLVDERIGPGSELAVIAPIDGANNYLVKGPVTEQKIHLAHGGAGSFVEVSGTDTTVAMDRETKTTLWSDITDSDAVTTILGQYGYTPDVDSTAAGHYETKHTLVQRDTDLQFVQRLARRNGFLFWIDCDEMGIETAHFKRAPLDGDPAGDLIINLDSNSLEAVDINWDVERPTSVVAAQLDLSDKSDIDGAVAQSPLTSLNAEALNAIAADTHSIRIVAPVDDAGDLQSRGEGALVEANWFIRATCQTTVNALKALVRAHTVINLRGAGTRFSGKYLVSGVRHEIDATAHRMDVELISNSWGS
jgi:phage protein D